MPPWVIWTLGGIGAALGGILLLLVLLLSTKFRITIGYSDGITLSIGIGLIHIRILPWPFKKKTKRNGPRSMSAAKARRIRERKARRAARKAEAKKPKPQKTKKKKKAKPAEQKAPKKEPRKLTASEILSLLDLVRVLIFAVVRRFFKHLRVDVARLKIKIATGDAATTAVAYGAATQAVNVLLPVLKKVKNFGLPSNTNFDICADFLGDTCEIDVKISFSIRLWQIIHIGLDGIFSVVKRKLSQLF